MYQKNIFVYEAYENNTHFLILDNKEFLLDEVGYEIWKMINGINKKDLEKKVIDFFVGDEEIIVKELSEFMEYLIDNDLIEEV